MDRRFIFLVLPGCFQPIQDLPKLDFSEMAYERPGLDSPSAVVRAFDMADHTCPDGEPARIYAVYSENAPAGAPVAVVLHSGAFDYIVSYEDGQEPLDGRHYRTESRLERPWALAKVWETLGLLSTPVDPGENNQGTLPVSMVNAGWVQLYPANCWGDLWHFDAVNRPNDAASEGFERDGLGLAITATRVVTEPGFAGTIGIDIPVQIDSSQLTLVGLGDGGRGVAELLAVPDQTGAIVASVLVDSVPDQASAYVDDTVNWFDVVVGMETIYGEQFTSDPNAGSLLSLYEAGLVAAPMGLIWSPFDYAVPSAATEPLADALSATEGTDLVVTNRSAGHIFVNSDPTLSDAAVGWLTDGVFEIE
jgi:hypothetical protein